MVGKSISAVEVSRVSAHGFSLRIDNRERWASFNLFPWFRTATMAQLIHVEHPSSDHLRWRELDIDLAVDSIDHPERFPLIAQ